MAFIEIVDIENGAATGPQGAVSLRLSASAPEEWIKFFGQAWIPAVVEGAIPADFGHGASVQGDRIAIPGASRAAVVRQMAGLRHVIAETNRIAAGYQGLLRRSHEAR